VLKPINKGILLLGDQVLTMINHSEKVSMYFIQFNPGLINDGSTDTGHVTHLTKLKGVVTPAFAIWQKE